MKYTAVDIKTKEEFDVIGKDSIGTLIKLKSKRDGITMVSNRCYYDIYREDGTLIEY